MKLTQPFFLIIILSMLSCKSGKITATKTDSNKWVQLFNGKNMDNWIPKMAGHSLGENYGNTFRVKDGVLSVRYDQYDHFQNKFGALYFDKKFSNYRLKVEYRFVGDTTPGAPSWGYRDGGIQYHGQSPATMTISQPFPVCLEYNLLGGNGTDDRPTGEICANGIYVEINGKRNTSYCTAPMVKRTIHGDAWVVAEIEVRNGTIKHFVNGEQVLEFKDPRYDKAHVLGKTFIVGENNVVKDGYISLQSNSNPIDFRKVEIMEYK